MSNFYFDKYPVNTPRKIRDTKYIGDVFKNTAKCLICMDVITSTHKHDFVTCSCGNLAVDGGSWYPRRLFAEPNSYEDMIEYYDDAKSKFGVAV